MTHVAVIDYGAGNLHSVCAGLQRVMKPGDTLELVSTPDTLWEFSHILLPGVGAYGDCISSLRAIDGMVDALSEAAMYQQKPFLGICVGMQMLFERGFEHGQHAGLGWMRGDVVALQPADATLKIPHMGWNDLHLLAPHKATSGIKQGDHAYFVHSYHVKHAMPSEILATCNYGGDIVAFVGRDNIIGTQFHPEKSQALGSSILANFLKM